jgi:hypothetical protein
MPTAAPPSPPGKSRAGLIAALVGLAALVGAAAFLFLGGDDDGDGGTAGDGTTTTDTVEVVDETTTSTEAGPTSTTDPFDAVQSVYVNQCVENPELQGQLPDATERQGFCQCTFDAIRSTVPFDHFLELEAEADRTNETPAELEPVLQPCVEQFS